MSAKCNGQCHGCAYKQGAAANQEDGNYLKSVFSALGGIPFYCHDSLGWSEEKGGYPGGAIQALAVLYSRRTLIEFGAIPQLIENQVVDIRREMRVCAGWKATIARLKAADWFANPRITLVRRHYAKSAAAALERLNADAYDRDGDEIAVIEAGVKWFFNEAREAGIKIGWLFAGRPR